MTTPYIGEIRIFGFPRIPTGWLQCNGALLSISEYDVLFTILGTNYGGNGISNFALPNLSGRVPINQGKLTGGGSYVLGQVSGTEEVTLTTAQMPAHNHNCCATNGPATSTTPGDSVVPGAGGVNIYFGNVSSATAVKLNPRAVDNAGGSLPHNNLMPTLTLSYCIAYVGIYPQQN